MKGSVTNTALFKKVRTAISQAAGRPTYDEYPIRHYANGKPTNTPSVTNFDIHFASVNDAQAFATTISQILPNIQVTVGTLIGPSPKYRVSFTI
ncbi:MAG: hypothetical protein ABSF09_11475 [Candidatus Bathyarchaeia archaeon]|jgi:hypothetical protein